MSARHRPALIAATLLCLLAAFAVTWLYLDRAAGLLGR